MNTKLHTLSLVIGLALSSTSMMVLAEDTGYETIVVSGQKIDRSIKETPTSVVVLTEEALEKQNAHNISDVFSNMANVSGDMQQGFSIRGIDAFNVSGGGNSYLATMYLDGAPLSYRVVRSGAVPIWDVAQVEVFRGPQSTLQGRNALAGAVHIRTHEPTYEWSGKAKVTTGTHGQQEFAFAGGGAIIEDMLAFRVSYEDKESDGDIDNITRNGPSNYEDTSSARFKLKFEPTDTFKALFNYTKTESELGPAWSTFNLGGSPFDRQTWFNSPVWITTDSDMFTLELNWELSDELSLVSVITTDETDYTYNWDGDMTAEQLTADNHYKRLDETDSLDLRLTYDGDDLQLVTGIYTSKLEVADKSLGERHIGLQAATGAEFSTLLTGFLMQNGLDLQTAMATAGQIVPLYPDIDPIVLSFNTSIAQEVKSSAVYADVTYHLTDNLELLAGLRYDKEEQSNASNALYTIDNQMPAPSALPAPVNQLVAGVNAYLNSFATAASGIEPPSSADFDAWLPKLGLSYHVNKDITTSVIYQRGFRSGGVGTNIAESYLFTYDEEYTDNFELSYRSVWLNGSLMFNANVFLTKWQDQQVQQQMSTQQYDIVTINAGESEIKGFETEVFYYPTKKLTITAGLGYAKSEFVDYQYTNPATSEIVDLSGNAFADAPDWTANVAVEYDFDSGLYLNANANYAGSSPAYLNPAQFAHIDGAPENDARTLVNLQLGYDFGNYQIRTDVRNLLDEDYISGYFNDAKQDDYGQHVIGRSRQISLTLMAEF